MTGKKQSHTSLLNAIFDPKAERPRQPRNWRRRNPTAHCFHPSGTGATGFLHPDGAKPIALQPGNRPTATCPTLPGKS
ncbi:MAG: hypothetical protein AB2558_05530 [Candidatus Thiodiazotropha sp.]